MIILRQHKDTNLSKHEITNHKDIEQLKSYLINLCHENEINATEIKIKEVKVNNGDYTHEVWVNHVVTFCSFDSLYGYAKFTD